jgi:hypothetical protein
MNFALKKREENKMMKNQKKLICLLFVLLFASAGGTLFSEGGQPQSDKEEELQAQLHKAKLSGDVQRTAAVQHELSAIKKEQVVQTANDDRFRFEPADSRVPFNGEGDINVSQIHNLNTWSNATATEPPNFPNYGKVWVAATEFRNGGPDTVKFYYSTNRGQSWVYYGKLFSNVNSDYRADELDIEMVYSGTDTYIFGTAAYDDFSANRTKCICFRISTTTQAAMVVQMNNPNFSGSNYHMYNPRITSDNSNYTSTTYLMMTYSCRTDCNGTDANYDTYYMYADFIFAAPQIHYVDFIGSVGCPLPLAPEYVIYSDVAYCNYQGHEQTMVLFHINAGAPYNYTKVGRYYGYNSYQTTAFLNETNENIGQRIAFTGGAGDAHGIVTYIRKYSATDWDVYAQRTSDGLNWTPQVVEGSTRRARFVDVIAQRNFVDAFKIGYIEDNPTTPAGFYAGCSGSSWSAPSGLIINNQPIDTTYTRVRAGYVYGVTDNCLAIYANAYTYYAYASRLCNTTVGVNSNTETPGKFSLEQNYPNPFNPSTKISFEVPKTIRPGSIVKLTVYDAAGREAAVLYNANVNPGVVEIVWDASAFPSGVYFYKLTAEGFTDTKKMVLIK